MNPPEKDLMEATIVAALRKGFEDGTFRNDMSSESFAEELVSLLDRAGIPRGRPVPLPSIGEARFHQDIEAFWHLRDTSNGMRRVLEKLMQARDDILRLRVGPSRLVRCVARQHNVHDGAEVERIVLIAVSSGHMSPKLAMAMMAALKWSVGRPAPDVVDAYVNWCIEPPDAVDAFVRWSLEHPDVDAHLDNTQAILDARLKRAAVGI
jgi:hypothetical protein